MHSIQSTYVDNLAFSMQFDDFALQYIAQRIVHCVWWRTGYKNGTKSKQPLQFHFVLAPLFACSHPCTAPNMPSHCHFVIAIILVKRAHEYACAFYLLLFSILQQRSLSLSRLILLTWTHCIEWWSVRSRNHTYRCAAALFDSSYLWTRSWRALPRTLPPE